MSLKSNKVGFSLLMGLLIGAGLGILFAPEKGTKTRKKLRKHFDDSKATLKETIDGLAQELKNKENQTKEKLEEIIDEAVREGNNSRDQLIEALEQKLKELKNGLSNKM